MDDVLVMRGLQRLGDLPPYFESISNGKRSTLQPIGEGLTIDQFHDEEVLPIFLMEPVDRCDVGVVEGG